MYKPFPKTADEIQELALSLIRHLRTSLADTVGRPEWTERNLDALRSFSNHGFDLKVYPPQGDNRRGAFLWDFVAYQQGSGILIAAETEWDSRLAKLGEDFDKLLYAQAPIKVLMFWLQKDDPRLDTIVEYLTKFMNSCSQYAPGEIYILYCRTWANPDGSNGDIVRWMQIPGDPTSRSADGLTFTSPQLT